jgi:hypothetical protein
MTRQWRAVRDQASCGMFGLSGAVNAFPVMPCSAMKSAMVVVVGIGAPSTG